MKNKFMKVLLGLFVFVAMPFTADAASGLKITCSDVTVNQTQTCKIAISSSIGITGADFNIKASGVSIESFSRGDKWGGGKLVNGKISVYNDVALPDGTVIGTITYKGVTVGQATISATNVLFTDGDFEDVDANNAAASFYVKAVTTKPTTKPTTKKTTTKKTTTTTKKATTTKSTTKKTTTTTKKGQTSSTTRKTASTSTTSTTRYTAGPITNPTTGSTNQQEPITNPSGVVITTQITHPTSSTTMTDANGNPITMPSSGTPGTPGGHVTYPTSIRYVTNDQGQVIWSEIINRTDAYYTEKTERPLRPYEKQFPGLKLVRVDNYQVVYKDGKYYTTTDPLDDEVIISAIPDEGTIVIGTGTRGIAPGKNVVDLVLKEGNETTTVQIVITRPSGVDVRDTSLTGLKIVDYEFEFDPSVTEYSISVPYTTKELYVIAKAYAEDATIGGDGLHTIIDNENNDIYVQVSYGSMAPTEYVIHVKKNYTMLILWIVIGLLSIGLIAMVIYANKTKKAAVSKVVAEKDAVIAEGNRAVTSEVAKDAVIGGQNLAGLTRKTVKPIQLNEIPQQQAPVQQTVVPGNEVSLVKKDPVELAQSAPQPQVRVIRRNDPQIKTTAASGVQYQEDNIVIKEL